jgi:hypothetical protein
MRLVETSKPTASRAIEHLVEAGVLVESTGKKRDHSYVYRTYVDRLKVGTEPPPRAVLRTHAAPFYSGAYPTLQTC